MPPIVYYRNARISRRELTVLNDVDLEVLPGQMVYIIGPVGSGKTSLIKTLYAEVPLKEADEARVLDFDLKTIRRGAVPGLRRQLGIIFQDFQLLTDRTAGENLDFVLRATGWRDKAARRERIEETMASVGMGNKTYKMPHELSGGEQQRVVIARALLNRPRLILADEPTGNLDPDTAHDVVGQLFEVSRRGTAVVMATHNLSLIDSFPGRVLECRDKQLREI